MCYYVKYCKNANNKYYRRDPLSRAELVDLKAQGLEYNTTNQWQSGASYNYTPENFIFFKK